MSSAQVLSFYQALHIFPTGVLFEFVLPCSFFLTECFQLRSFSLHSFFLVAQPCKVRGFTRLSKKQLNFTSSLPRPLFSGAILDLGTRSSCSGGVLSRPETDVPGVLRLFAVVALSFACVLHPIMSSCALHHHVFKTCIRPGLLILSVVRSEPRHTCTRPRHVRNIIL